MDTIDDSLLPAATESPRCAPFTEDLAVDPGGTALHLDELIVVDVPGPWPKPVWSREGFTAVPEWVMAAESMGRRVRVLAAVAEPEAERAPVVVHRRRGPEFRREEHRVAVSEVVLLLEALLSGGLDASAATLDIPAVPERSLLVCTQGSHDVCCGSRGPAVAASVAAARPDIEVRRVSHTGGHRFAPTGVSLPDGRMWGGLDPHEWLAVLDRTGSPADLAPRCRGWTGASEGPAQVAERAVFALVDDWDFDRAERSADVVGSTGADAAVVVTAGVRTWDVEVVPGRAVPTITCGAPGGLPAKPGTEWRVASVRER